MSTPTPRPTEPTADDRLRTLIQAATLAERITPGVVDALPTDALLRAAEAFRNALQAIDEEVLDVE